MTFRRPTLPRSPTGLPLSFPLSSITTERFETEYIRILDMLNNSGATVLMGSCVIFDGSITTSLAFTTSTVQDDRRIIGATKEDIASGQQGGVVVVGLVELLVAAGTNANQRLRQSTTAGIAEGTVNTTEGTFAIARSNRNPDTLRALALLLPSPRGTAGWVLGSSLLGIDTILN